MSLGDDFILTLFTNDPVLAARADVAGVNRIGLDLEKLNKHIRQNPDKCWVSDHKIEQLTDVKNALQHARLFARTNPIHNDSNKEIEYLISSGVEVLMLPMYRSEAEVRRFVDIIDGRATVSLLAETAGAAYNMKKIVKIPGIDEIHIGLNDLHLDLGLLNHFEALASNLLERLSEIVRSAGIPFGFGGIGRLHDTTLPISSELIYPQYPYLGADRALVARVFTMPNADEIDLGDEIQTFRSEMNRLDKCTEFELLQMRKKLKHKVTSWNNNLVKKKDVS